ncbi:AAA family ATPase [Geomonas sp. RF6]|nr:AAA family ATPase [Geomonas sp. RF6]
MSDGSILSQMMWLEPHHFQDGEIRTIFSAIQRLKPLAGPIPLSLLDEHLADKCRRRDLLALAAKLSETDVLSIHAPRLAKLVVQHANESSVQQLASQLVENPGDLALQKQIVKALTTPLPGNSENGVSLLRTGEDLRALDVKVEWIVDNLIPRDCVTVLFGRGGIGKTTLSMMMAAAIDKGVPIFGMSTVKTKVIVIDFENSLPVLSERAKRTAVDGVLFWDSSSNPPGLDEPGWVVYKEILKKYPGALFIFDTLRSAHSGDENDSKVMSLVMRRLRNLRDAGATVIVLHHTPKSNDRQFKGSGAILDLCDHVVALFQTRRDGDEEEVDDIDAIEKIYRFGTGKKSRYRPHRVYLRFDKEDELFTLAEDPEAVAIDHLQSIIGTMYDGIGPNQSAVVAAAERHDFDFGSARKIRALLKKGEGVHWAVTTRGINNAISYAPI